MSTKTAFKRVALVAAAALAIGGISAVSANASATGSFTGSALTVTGSAATATATVGTYLSTTIAFGTDTNNADNVTSSGVGSLNVPSIPAVTAGTPAIALATTGITSTGFTAFAASHSTEVPGSTAQALSGLSITVSAYSATAGTQTISFTGSTGTATLTITWGAAPVLSTQFSTYGTAAGTSSTIAGDTTTHTAISAAAGTGIVGYATQDVRNNSGASGTSISTEKLTATVSGPGFVAWGHNASGFYGEGTAGAVVYGKTITAATAGDYVLQIIGDNTAGTATITVADGTTTLASFTVTFYGVAAKAVATQNLFVAKAGAQLGYTAGNGAAPTGNATYATGILSPAKFAYTVAVTDANGNPVDNSTYVKATSSDTTVINSSACLESTTAGTYNCSVTAAVNAASGKTATVTFSASTDAGTTYTVAAAPLTFAIGGGIATEKLASDSASYNALAPIALKLTAVDSSGNAAYDETVAAGLTNTLVSSAQLGGANFSATSFVTLINGSSSLTGVYAPAVAGDFTISGTDAVSTAGEAITVTATSNGGSSDAAANAATDAANEATDAANAATDAANAAADSADAATAAAQDAGDKADAALAAVTALSQQVTTLLSKVAALAATIAKIAKKVKA